MAGRNNTPLVGWHPKSADHLAWLEAEVQRRGGGRGVRSDLLDEMLAAFIAAQGSNYAGKAVTTRRASRPKPALPRTVTEAEKADEDAHMERARNRPALAAVPEPCPHPKGRVHKGLCGNCGTNVGTTNGAKK